MPTAGQRVRCLRFLKRHVVPSAIYFVVTIGWPTMATVIGLSEVRFSASTIVTVTAPGVAGFNAARSLQLFAPTGDSALTALAVRTAPRKQALPPVFAG